MWDGIGVALWYEIHLLPPAPWISTGSRLLPPSSPIPLGIPPPPSLASPLHHSRQNRLPDSANQFIRMMYVIMFWFHQTKYNGLFFFLPSMSNVITVIKEDNWKGSAASALKEDTNWFQRQKINFSLFVLPQCERTSTQQCKWHFRKPASLHKNQGPTTKIRIPSTVLSQIPTIKMPKLVESRQF